MTITAPRLHDIRRELAHAGNHWQSAAAGIREISSAVAGDGQLRDHCTLTDTVETPAGDLDGVVLYRDETTGKWWATDPTTDTRDQLYRADAPTVKTPTDVFTRILTDNIGGRVSVTDIHGNNHRATVEAVEADVVTLFHDGDPIYTKVFEDYVPKESRHYIRIDQLSTVTTQVD
ncbi:hypothetical protein GS481_02945 [Rhodococcus hoagii]|nr:hypothetical protein [Prescottella equi]NKR53112.1 hypothetical protein [Prescottella equi]